ncbi:MAG: hypothetical protein LBU48_00890, partial [Coriobacteriales bacterium]|nr:hypothetical protein [Coriobacteriales bacterium]
MVASIIKRDGRAVNFELEKISDAIEKAFNASGAMKDRSVADKLAKQVLQKLEDGAIEGVPTVEGVQDLVEVVLAENGFVQTSKSYILYRQRRAQSREANSKLMLKIGEITFSKSSESDVMRENANIDADTAMGTMLKYGSETAKQYYQMSVLPEAHAKAHAEGDIH